MVVGHPCIFEQCIDFAVRGQGLGVQVERKVGVSGLPEEDKFVGSGVERIEQATGLLKSIQASRIVAEGEVCLTNIAQRLSL